MKKQILPFTDNKVWEYFQWHSYFSEKYKLFYVSTPKVACTSLKWWFAALEGLTFNIAEPSDSPESDPVLIIHDHLRKVAPEVTGLERGSLIRPISEEGIFRFAVVKNPYKRLFSAWQSKILLREPLQFKNYIKYEFPWSPIKSIGDIAQSFENFVEHLYSKEAPNYWDVHWTPQITLLRPDLISYTYLSRIENVKELSVALAQHLGPSIPNPFVSAHLNEGLLPYLPDFITRRSAKLIQSMYAEDFNELGYDYQPPKNHKKISETELELFIRSMRLIHGRHQRLTEIREIYSDRIENFKVFESEQKQQTENLNQMLIERNNQIARINQILEVREGQIIELNHTLTARDEQIANLTGTKSEMDIQVNNLKNILAARDERIQLMTSSRSWRITHPYRFIGDIVRSLWATIQKRKNHALIAAHPTQISHHVPAKPHEKNNRLFRKALAIIVRYLPLKPETRYQTLRTIYRKLPIPYTIKVRWAEELLMDAPKLRTPISLANMEPEVASVDLPNAQEKIKMDRKKILIVEHRLPTPDRNSSSVRLYAILKLIRELGWEITFFSNSTDEDYHWILSNIKLELPKYEKAVFDMGIKIFYGVNQAIDHLQLEGDDYQYAFLSYPEIMHQYAPLVRAYMPNAHLIYDTVDLHGIRFLREAVIKNDDQKLIEKSAFYEKMECANIESADTVIAITDDERVEILNRFPAASVKIIPNIHALSYSHSPFDERDGLLFIGHYLHSPNEDAVLFFVHEVFPRIQAELGNIPFYILGSSMTQKIKSLNSHTIKTIGFVEEPTPWFEKARIFIAPLRYGAGMKGKIGQSLGLGLPVVTTSIGAEGMMLENETHALVADAPIDFANAVVRLYNDDDLWNKLRNNGLAHISHHFSEGAARKKIYDLLHFEDNPVSQEKAL